MKLCSKGDSHTLLEGMYIGTNTLENCLTISNKAGDAHMLWPITQGLGIKPRNSSILVPGDP